MVKSFVFVGNTEVGEIISERLLKCGFRAAYSADSAEAIIIYCESQTDLEDVFFDSAGLVQSATPGTFLINLSASTPGFARELDAVSLVSDLYSIEAPLLVKDPLAERAFSDADNLSCFVAGESERIDAIKPLLEAICSDVRITGSSGSAQLAHAGMTILRSAQLVAGIELEAMYKALSQPSDAAILAAYELGIIKQQGVRLHNAIKNELFEGEYTAAMWMADLSAALMTADDCELILPGTESCLHLLELLVVVGGASMSTAALSLVYGEEAQCAKHGLDWTRAEQAYAEDEHEHHDDCDCGHTHNHDDLSGGFSAYSAN
ncbi:MAG: NAD(P)-binding domain-containing protein [Raoultibacter sp.]|jgi:3-hydroxyisobutyrate dehydrogenase